ncbi:MAG: MBL fold metallo-hydrolase [Acidobacteria bacterium]|nr:MAG: MBL fold metallo-hydrolase [Acidobacteriota bacterium]
MADPNKRLPFNVPGEFFVDRTCIDCDVCRQLAPQTFDQRGEFSYVRAQPRAAEQRRRAWRALLCCPTGSIGALGRNRARTVMQDFPLHLGERVYYCGFNSPKSYGGHSYFIRHPQGNWLIDSPKYLPYLVKRFEEWGGIRTIFLTHRDDVADAHLYARRFHSQRLIHRADRCAQPDAEVLIEGRDPVVLTSDFVVIPTPGHTPGHAVLLYKNRFLFSGDHLWWSRTHQRLSASPDVCWYSWSEQTASMIRLRDVRFEWVLPGHGQWARRPVEVMRRELAGLVDRMRMGRRVSG